MLQARRLQLAFASFLILLCQACVPKQQVIEPSQAAITSSAVQHEVVPSQVAIVAPTPSPDHSAISEPVMENDQVAQAINAIAGGKVSLTVANGDLIQLSIPPFALSEDAEVSLVAYSNPLAGPF